MTEGSPVGLVLGSAIAPERLGETARLGEELGFGELWFAEDCFFTGGISGATAALAATERVPVGLGIVSAVTRHPALLAMEISTLARMFPGRVLPGVGLGVPAWLEQMGLRPRSPLSALRECVTSLRRLLAGDEVTEEGRQFSFDRVKLAYVPEEHVPIYMGVVAGKGLRLAGAVADGLVLSVLASSGYVSWAMEQAALGAGEAGRPADHRVAAFAMFSVDRDRRRAKAALRGTAAFYLAAGGRTALTDAFEISDELEDMIARGGVETVEREFPERWLDELTVSGDPDECAEGIRRYLEAGADSVVLFPLPSDRSDEILRTAAADVLPRL